MKRILAMALLCLQLSARSQTSSERLVDSLKQHPDYIVDDSLLIPTRDGYYISGWTMRKKSVSYPAPALFQFSIYARQTDIRKLKEMADHGYVGVLAYSRGKRYSAGDAIPYEYDGRDAYDVIEWITQQSWSDRRVGMYGGSYNGFTQWAAAKQLHPALKTIVPSVSVAPGLDVPMTNNVMMSFVFPWTYYVSNNKFLDETDYRGTHWQEMYFKWFEEGRSYRSLDTMIGRPGNKIFQRWLDHPTYDHYWQSMIPYREEFKNINIPVLTTTGYFDGGQISALYYMREHVKYVPQAEHYLLIGPFGHFGAQGFPDSVYNGYPIDPVARIPIHDIIFEWFDYIFFKKPKPSILKNRINYQPMGTNTWKSASTLKEMSNARIRFYPVPSADSSGIGILSTSKPLTNTALLQTVDFKDREGMNSYYYLNRVIYDSIFPNYGLMLTSEPFKHDIEIAGNFTGQLAATINKRDMDFSVVLFEQTADGKYFYLGYFMGRASYARNMNQRQLLAPGKKQWIPFSNSYMTSKKINSGSRIMAILNVNKSAFEQINYGTGKAVNAETIADAGEPLQIKWHSDSYIDVPVWKASAKKK